MKAGRGRFVPQPALPSRPARLFSKTVRVVDHENINEQGSRGGCSIEGSGPVGQGSVKMTYEAETRKAFYSAGEFFGAAELVIRRKGDPSPDPTFVNVIARLAEAKGFGKGEFTSCGKEAIRSEEGRAALVRFVELWPKIKSVAEGLIETGDISGEQFIGKFYRRVTAGLAVQPR